MTEAQARKRIAKAIIKVMDGVEIYVTTKEDFVDHIRAADPAFAEIRTNFIWLVVGSVSAELYRKPHELVFTTDGGPDGFVAVYRLAAVRRNWGKVKTPAEVVPA